MSSKDCALRGCCVFARLCELVLNLFGDLQKAELLASSPLPLSAHCVDGCTHAAQNHSSWEEGGKNQKEDKTCWFLYFRQSFCNYIVFLDNSDKSWAEVAALVKNKNLDTGVLAGVKYLPQKLKGSGLAVAPVWHQITLQDIEWFYFWNWDLRKLLSPFFSFLFLCCVKATATLSRCAAVLLGSRCRLGVRIQWLLSCHPQNAIITVCRAAPSAGCEVATSCLWVPGGPWAGTRSRDKLYDMCKGRLLTKPHPSSTLSLLGLSSLSHLFRKVRKTPCWDF